MTIEQTLLDNHENYLKKLADFSAEQQDKVANLINDSNQVFAEFKPFEKAKEIDSMTSDLLQQVNDELDKAMDKVNQQMAIINQSTS